MPARKRTSGRSGREAPAGSPVEDASPADALSPGGSIEDIGSGGSVEPLEDRPTFSRLIVRAGIASWSIVGILIVVAALFYVLRQIEPVFPPLIVGAVMVLLLEPFVARLVARGLRRGLAVTIVYLVVLAILFAIGFFAIPAMVRQGQEFARDLPKLLESGGTLASGMLRRLNQGDAGERLREAIGSYLGTNAESIPRQVSRFASIGLRLANFAVTTIIGLILGFYGLLALPKMSAAFTRIVPAERRAVIAPVGARVRSVFTGYLRARIIVSLAVGLLATIGLWLVGMPFWLLLGIIVAVANLIPVLGSVIGGIPVLLVAAVTKPLVYLLVALVVLIVAHAIDGYILSPIVLRGTTDMHPIVVLLAVLVGGAVLGLWGILAAVPIAGAIQVLVLELVRRRRLAAEAGAVPT